MGDFYQSYLGFVFLVLLIGLYFLPVIIAYRKNHQAIVGIIIVNIIVGWTLIGWIVCLIWSYSGSKKEVLSNEKIIVSMELNRLSELLEKDLISKEEFDKLKKDLMER